MRVWRISCTVIRRAALSCMDTRNMTIWEIYSRDGLKFLGILVSVYEGMEDLLYSNSESCVVLYTLVIWQYGTSTHVTVWSFSEFSCLSMRVWRISCTVIRIAALSYMDTCNMTTWKINSRDSLKFLRVLVSVYEGMEDLLYSDSESCVVLQTLVIWQYGRLTHVTVWSFSEFSCLSMRVWRISCTVIQRAVLSCIDTSNMTIWEINSRDSLKFLWILMPVYEGMEDLLYSDSESGVVLQTLVIWQYWRLTHVTVWSFSEFSCLSMRVWRISCTVIQRAVLSCIDTSNMTIWEINSRDSLKFLVILVSVYEGMEDLLYSDSESCVVLYGH